MSVLLALDSSTEHMALALVGQGHAAFMDADGGALASQRLVPDAMALLREAGMTLASVDAIAFGRGPGAFTGLRTACSVAQGLALGADRPVVGLDSLMLVAEDARLQAGVEDDLDLWVAMDARMNQIYAGRYRWSADRWTTVVEPMLVDPAPLQALWHEDPPACIAGSALISPDYALDTGSARRVERTVSRARALGSLAQQVFAQGGTQDPADALPLYVRDKVALTTAERAQAKAAS